MFDQSGVPLGMIAGPANLLLESVGGELMIVGLAVPVIGVLMAVNMVGAWVSCTPARCTRSTQRPARP